MKIYGDLSLEKINTTRQWIWLTMKGMLDRLRIITDSCLPTRPIGKDRDRSNDFVAKLQEGSGLAIQLPLWPAREREALPSLSFSIFYVARSIIPTLRVSPVPLPFVTPYDLVAAGPVHGPTDPRRVQSAFRTKCECVRTHIRTHAWTDKATGTRSKDVRFALLLEIHRDSRAVCGRPAAKREKGAGTRKSAAIVDSRYERNRDRSKRLRHSRIVLVRLNTLRGNREIVTSNRTSIRFDSISARSAKRAHARGFMSLNI